MSMKELGGNKIDQFNLNQPGKQVFGSGPYEYYFYRTRDAEELMLADLRSFSVYLLNKPSGASVHVKELNQALEQGDRIQAEGSLVHLTIAKGPVQFLVAGTAQPHPEAKGLVLTRHADLYRVIKPWGHEIWINGQHPCYALKQIFVKQGTKTSLQYHNFKQETNVLFEGRAKLHYKSNADVPNDRVTAADISTHEIQPVSTVGVVPPVLHRLEAVTDILLYETSTPHLDDVVRVQDDSRRPHGRIETEHGTRT